MPAAQGMKISVTGSAETTYCILRRSYTFRSMTGIAAPVAVKRRRRYTVILIVIRSIIILPFITSGGIFITLYSPEKTIAVIIIVSNSELAVNIVVMSTP